METVAQQYGFLALLVYVVLKDGIPVVGKIFGKVLPIREKRISDEVAAENDLREREIVAQEMIGKQMAVSNQNFAVSNERLLKIETSLQALMTASISQSQTLAVLLDRVQRTPGDFLKEGKNL